MEAYQDRTGWCMRLYNPEVSPGTENTIKISGPPESLPAALVTRLEQCGRDWKQIVFSEETTGATRYTGTMAGSGGHFATNLWFLQSTEAQRLLELSENQAAYKHRIKIAAGTTAMVGRMTSSNVVQFCFPDTTGLVFYESVPTD